MSSARALSAKGSVGAHLEGAQRGLLETCAHQGEVGGGITHGDSLGGERDAAGRATLRRRERRTREEERRRERSLYQTIVASEHSPPGSPTGAQGKLRNDGCETVQGMDEGHARALTERALERAAVGRRAALKEAERAKADMTTDGGASRSGRHTGGSGISQKNGRRMLDPYEIVYTQDYHDNNNYP